MLSPKRYAAVVARQQVIRPGLRLRRCTARNGMVLFSSAVSAVSGQPAAIQGRFNSQLNWNLYSTFGSLCIDKVTSTAA